MISTLFIQPKKIRFCDNLYHGCFSYTDYNYLKPGLPSKIKIRHFEIALKLTSKYFNKINVIDLGCADGPFLPSLSNYFNYVVGIDIDPTPLARAEELSRHHHLNNVSLYCNNDTTLNEIKKKINSKPYSIIFVMEVLEHVGNNWKTMYPDKIKFLKDATQLIETNGLIVISVPKMTGISFLIQIMGQILFNLGNKKDILSLSISSILKCVFFNDTDDIEHMWVPYSTHVGFNHKKLEKYLIKEFDIVESKSDIFQQIYVVKRRL